MKKQKLEKFGIFMPKNDPNTISGLLFLKRAQYNIQWVPKHKKIE